MGVGGVGDGTIGFVGRESERQTLRTAFTRARDEGRGSVVLVAGEAGIGKSTLIDVACASAEEDGSVIVRCAASVLDRSRPFGPLIDALGLSPSLHRGDLPGTVELERRWLADVLSGRPDDGRRSPLQTVAEERGRIIEGIAALLDAWALEAPVALVVDDLQWADTATLAALGRARVLAMSQGLVLVLAYRPLPRSEELEALVSMSRPDATAITLGPLGAAAVEDLVAAAAGGRAGPRLSGLAANAGGNPFLIVELVHALAHGGHLRREGPTVEIADAVVPVIAREVHDGIVGRMADLGSSAASLLQVAAAFGPRFTVGDLALVTRRTVPDLLGDTTLAVKAGLLVDDDLELRFRHDLVREAIESTVTRSALAALHLEIANALASANAPAVRVATYYSLGAQPGDRSAVRWLRAAAREIVTRSPSSAAELLDRALGLTDITDPGRDELVAQLVDAVFWSGQVEKAAELAASALARPLAVPVAAALHETTARAMVLLGRPSDAVTHAQAIVGTPEQHAWVTALDAIFRLFALDLDGALEQARAAVTLAERGPDAWAATLGLCVLCWIDNVRGFHERAAESAARAVRAADSSTNFEAHRLIPHLFHGLALESAGRSAEAQATLVHGQALAERLATTWATPFYHYALALPHWNAGRWDDVLAECEAGLRYATAHDVSLASGWACAVSGSAHLHRNELDKAEELISDGEARLARGGVQYGIDWVLWARGLLTEAKGDAAGARAILAAGWDVAEGLQAAAALVLVGPDLVRMSLDAGDRERARAATEALEQAEPDADRRNVDGHALRCRGLLDCDLETLVAAKELHERCLRPVEVVLDQEAMVVTALRRGQVDTATALLAETLDACDRLGMRMVAERTLRCAARLGLTRAPRRRARQITGWEALTDTEQRVARLVAAGRSNPQVAHELVISRRTVESHLYRIFFKLGVANRTELAGVVHRLSDGA